MVTEASGGNAGNGAGMAPGGRPSPGTGAPATGPTHVVGTQAYPLSSAAAVSKLAKVSAMVTETIQVTGRALSLRTHVVDGTGGDELGTIEEGRGGSTPTLCHEQVTFGESCDRRVVFLTVAACRGLIWIPIRTT